MKCIPASQTFLQQPTSQYRSVAMSLATLAAIILAAAFDAFAVFMVLTVY